MHTYNGHLFELDEEENRWYECLKLSSDINKIIHIKCSVCGFKCSKFSNSDLIYYSLRVSLCTLFRYELSCSEQMIKNILE